MLMVDQACLSLVPCPLPLVSRVFYNGQRTKDKGRNLGRCRHHVVYRQCDVEGRALAEPVALDPDLAALGVDEVARDRQADAGAAAAARARFIHPVETLEDV